jgi:hypothetical protein
MDLGLEITAVLVCALIFLPPTFLFMPLIVAIANRISGKMVGAKEVNELKDRVAKLENELSHLHTRLMVAEDTTEFTRKLVEDKTAKEKQ